MRITMVGSLPPIKGMSAYCLQLVQGLSKLIEIEFINFKSIYPPIIYPIATTEDDRVFKVNFNNNVNVINRLRWYHPIGAAMTGLRIKNKIIHFHWWTSFLFIVFYPLILMAKLRKKKVVCTVHNVLGHESNIIDRILCKLMLMLPDKFVVHTEKNKEQLAALFNINYENIDVIPHGRYDFYIEKSIDIIEAKQHLGYNQNDKIVLFFGQIRSYKGVDVLLEAIASVKNEIPNLKCIVAGKTWVSWDKYQSIIDKHNLSNIVKADREYVPSSEVQYLYSGADVVVLPYKKFDSQSGPGNIALGFGKPLVVSRVGGLPDLVKDEGVIYEPEDVDGLTKSLIRVLKDNKYSEKLEKDSKELAEKYDWNKIAERIANLYQGVMLEN